MHSSGIWRRSSARSAEDRVERPWNALEVECLDHDARVTELAASAATHEPSQLLFGRAAAPRRHLLERPKAMQITVGLEELLDRRRAQRANQLVLEVRVAHIEPKLLQFAAEARAFERSAEHGLLPSVAETREPYAVTR